MVHQSPHDLSSAGTPTIIRIHLTHGLEISCRTWGNPNPTGTPIVMVHGLASNAQLWDGAARHLSALGHGVVAIDQRGHGTSDKPDDGYDMDTVTDDLAAVIDSLTTNDATWSRPIVIGQSWGGNIVVHLAWKHAQRIRGVCAVDGGTIDLKSAFPDWEDCASQLAPPHIAGTRYDRLWAAIKATHPDWPDDAIDATLANMEHLPDGTVRPWLTRDRHMKILRGLWEHSPHDLFPDITVPVMFAPALDDSDFSHNKRASLERAVQSLDRSRVAPFIGADHDLHAQYPRQFADAIHAAITEGFFA